MSERVSRRDVLRSAAVAGVGLGVAGTAAVEAAAEAPKAKGRPMIGVPFEAHESPRFGIIGLGNRGGGMLPLLLEVPGARVTALCDIRPDYAAKAAELVTGAGQPEPALYTAGDHDYENLCARDDVDFVYVATPWEWHTQMSL